MITRYIVEIETAHIGDEFSADWVQDVIETNLENDATQRVNVKLVKLPSEDELLRAMPDCCEQYDSMTSGERIGWRHCYEWMKSKILK